MKEKILEILNKCAKTESVDVTSRDWIFIPDYDFSKVADEILLLIKPKKGKKEFMPPTKEEVMQFFKENGYQMQSGINAWNYYNDGNWHDSHGKPVLSWKQKMRAVWFKPENKAIETQSQMIR